MIKIRHKRLSETTGKEAWQDAFLLSFVHDQFGQEGISAVISYQNEDFNSEQGMKVTRERQMSKIRIARSVIPLLEPHDAS